MARTFATLIALVSVVVCLGAQEPTADPRHAMEGPWELVSGGVVHGIFIQLPGNSFEVQLYHRPLGGTPSWGWFVAPANDGARLDGVHLVVRDLDVTFDAAERRWTGTWPQAGAGAVALTQFANNVVRGQLLNHIASSDGRITLITNSVTGLPFRYVGEISPDGSRMTGEWTSLPGGPMSSLPSIFVRANP